MNRQQRRRTAMQRCEQQEPSDLHLMQAAESGHDPATVLDDVRATINESSNRDLYERALRLFAETNGWTAVPDGRTFGFQSLRDNTRMRKDFFCLYSSVLDHPRAFEKAGNPVCLIGQPYVQQSVSATIETAEALATKNGLSLHQPPAIYSSFYYPGACLLFAYTRPGELVRWLPQQMDSCGLYAFADGDWPLFRDFIDTARLTNDAQGDFIRDTREVMSADAAKMNSLPRTFLSFDHFTDVMGRRYAAFRNREHLARAAWTRFEQWRDRRLAAMAEFN